MEVKMIRCICTENGRLEITINREYIVNKEDLNSYRIKNDIEKYLWYNKEYFIEMEEKKDLNIIEASNLPYGTEFKVKIDHYYKYDDACRIRNNIKLIAVNTQSGIKFKEYADIERASKTLINAKFVPIQSSVTFEEAKKEYRENKKPIQSCVSERIFRNGVDVEIGFSEIEGQWIVLD